eukprot:TRINITY_DN71819_c0_g1_i1.p1 TRINITY_DN71819_c0_g1~~TRINITY_DN71819_c0_g1_i1.p1  ORF type:complete len:227 (-),score=41.17 TRINITY_DN71819_c0_g1_i1:45-668(-)
MSGCLGIILASLTTNLVFPICLLIPATRDSMSCEATDTQSNAASERWERRMGAVSKHKRRLARTRQIFKLPRCSSIKRIKETIASDENKIWTVTAKDPESIVNPTKLEMKTTAWGSGLDMEQMRYMRFNGQLRMPYKGQNKDDIEFTDIGAIEETRNSSRGMERTNERRTRRINKISSESKSIKTSTFCRVATREPGNTSLAGRRLL